MIRPLRAQVLAVVLTLTGAAAGPGAPSVLAQGTAPPGALRGDVVDVNGAGMPGMVVQLKGGDARIRVVATGEAGDYAFTGLVPGGYVVSVVPQGNWAEATANVPIGRTEVTRNLVLQPKNDNARLQLLLGCIAAYLLFLLLFRYFNIVRPTREHLKAQIEAVRTRLHLEADPDKPVELRTLENELTTLAQRTCEWTPSEGFFWSQGRENAMWRRIHEVERQLVAFLIPPDRVLESLYSAAVALKGDTTPEASALAARIEATLIEVTRAGDPAARTVSPEQIKQLLAEALATLYKDRDNKFAALMEWHNKAMWMVAIALAAIVVLGLVFHHEELFLIGVVGGLMSRMTRSLNRADVPTDYGASWTTLFLSPLLGAIAAWFGIVVIIVLLQLGVLGDALAGVRWDGALYTPLVIGLAFVLGFSERFFLSLLSAVENRVQSQIDKASGQRGTPVAAALPVVPGVEGGAAATRTGASVAAQPADRVVQQLDLQSGNRAAFIGDPASPSRQRLNTALGAGNVLAVETNQLSTVGSVDAILLETVPAAAGLAAAGSAIAAALAHGGRLVVVGTTPAVSFEDSADVHRQRNHAGPTLVDQRFTEAGLLAEEPPERLSGTDPVRWCAIFSKP